MQIYKDKEENIYTDKDYLLDSGSLEAIVCQSETANFHVDHEDYVASVPGTMTLKEFDENLISFAMCSNIKAPEDYSISKILAEFQDQSLLHKVLGLNLTHVDGSLTKTGAKVIKNVSGYDMKKLYIGSFNSLAIITNAFLRLEKRFEKQLQISFRLTVDSKAIFEIKKFLQSFLDSNIDFQLSFNKLFGDYSAVIYSSNSQKILEYREKAINTFLEKLPEVKSSIKIEYVDFQPEYKTEKRMELDFDFSKLDVISLLLTQEDYVLDVLNSTLYVDHVQRELLQDLLLHIKALRIFPVNFQTRDELKNLLANNDKLLDQIKLIYDEGGSLNPGLL